MGACEQWIGRAIRWQLDRSSLTAERERELLLQYKTGESQTLREAALAELWESHSKLVVAIAARYRRSGISQLDLIGAGHLGLHAAIARFDLARDDVRLASFAQVWIRRSIIEHVRRASSLMRLPETGRHRTLFHMRERLIRDARMSCLRDGVEPTDAEVLDRVGQRVGLSADDVACSLMLLGGGALSLDESGPDDDGRSLLDTLADESADTEDDVILRLDQEKARRRIAELMDEILGERERAVFRARCLPDHEPTLTLDELAARFGISRERVHQLEASARRKIATALINEGFGPQGAPTMAAHRTQPAAASPFVGPARHIRPAPVVAMVRA